MHIHTATLLPEAELEEVLDSLRLRIRSMFKWAKSEVSGFEDLSPLDQKALLRRTVAELVMLGFARGSIAYDGEPPSVCLSFFHFVPPSFSIYGCHCVLCTSYVNWGTAASTSVTL